MPTSEPARARSEVDPSRRASADAATSPSPRAPASQRTPRARTQVAAFVAQYAPSTCRSAQWASAERDHATRATPTAEIASRAVNAEPPLVSRTEVPFG